MTNSVQTLPAPASQALPPAWRVPAMARVVLSFARRKPLGAIGGVIVLTNLSVDLLYAVLDPRIRY